MLAPRTPAPLPLPDPWDGPAWTTNRPLTTAPLRQTIVANDWSIPLLHHHHHYLLLLQRYMASPRQYRPPPCSVLRATSCPTLPAVAGVGLAHDPHPVTQAKHGTHRRFPACVHPPYRATARAASHARPGSAILRCTHPSPGTRPLVPVPWYARPLVPVPWYPSPGTRPLVRGYPASPLPARFHLRHSFPPAKPSAPFGMTACDRRMCVCCTAGRRPAAVHGTPCATGPAARTACTAWPPPPPAVQRAGGPSTAVYGRPAGTTPVAWCGFRVLAVWC